MKNNQAWSTFVQLREKATAKYDRLLREPSSTVHDLSRSYQKAFHAFSALWSFQAAERRALVEAGLHRADIGEIASKIGHLHFNWYLRCADIRFLVESYVFYEAIHARQYFQDTLIGSSYHAAGGVQPGPGSHGASTSQQQTTEQQQQQQQQAVTCSQAPTVSTSQLADASAAVEQQLRYYARFILVCIMLGKKEEAVNLMQEFQALVMSHTMVKELPTAAAGSNSMALAATAHQEWQFVLTEVGTLLMADPGMPLPRSPGAALSWRPCSRICPAGGEAGAAPHTSLIHHAVLVGYHHRQVKMAEFPIDMMRMMQALEWLSERLESPVDGNDSLSSSHYPDASTPAPTTNGHSQSKPPLPGHTRTHSHTGSWPALDVVREATNSNGGHIGSPAVGANGGSPAVTQRTRMLHPTSSTDTSSCQNPRKTLLYRTTTPALLSALHSAAATLETASNRLLFVYLSCSSIKARLAAATAPLPAASTARGLPAPRLPPVPSTSCLTAALAVSAASATPTATDLSGNDLSQAWCLSPPPMQSGAVAMNVNGNGSTSAQYPTGRLHTSNITLVPGAAAEHALLPEDLKPLTRHRLFVVADGDVSHELTRLSGSELSHPIAALMSPVHRPRAFGDAAATGQLFTLFLTLPVSGFCLIMGEMHPSPTTLRALQDAVDESLANIAVKLKEVLCRPASSSSRFSRLGSDPGHQHHSSPAIHHHAPVHCDDDHETVSHDHAVWAAAYQDVFLRSLMCRFVLARAAFAYHRASTGRPECQACCSPALPADVSPSSQLCVDSVLRVAAVLKRQALFEGYVAVQGGQLPTEFYSSAGPQAASEGAHPQAGSIAAAVGGGVTAAPGSSSSSQPMSVPNSADVDAESAAAAMASLALKANAV